MTSLNPPLELNRLAAQLFKLPLVVAAIIGLFALPAVADNVTITDRGTHYDVVLDLENGATHRQIGEEYGEKLRTQVPQFERELDSYLAENCSSWIVHAVVMHRIRQIKKNIPQEYKDEIEGIASRLSGGEDDDFGDGKISEDELYLFNLLGDVARLYQCSACAVYGSSSATGSTIVGRNFDWPDGRKAQLAKLQSVVTIKNGPRSTVNVGCLGFQGAVSAFNRHGVFAAVLDSPTGAKYSPKNKRSYLLDLRQALENSQTLNDVARWMQDPEKPYSCNHLIILADKQTSVVLENNVSNKHGERGVGHRAIRTATSQLHPGVSWGIPDAIGCVNCFQLAECDENSLDPTDKKAAKKNGDKPVPEANLFRWQSLKSQLAAQGPPITIGGIKQVLSFYHPESRGDMYKGDLYNWFTIQSVVFEPARLHLEVGFRPRDGKMPYKPRFETIPLHISPAETRLTEAN